MSVIGPRAGSAKSAQNAAKLTPIPPTQLEDYVANMLKGWFLSVGLDESETMPLGGIPVFSLSTIAYISIYHQSKISLHMDGHRNDIYYVTLHDEQDTPDFVVEDFDHNKTNGYFFFSSKANAPIDEIWMTRLAKSTARWMIDYIAAHPKHS